MKTLVQCDFDGTITREDVSFLLLDAFTNSNWRKLLEDYREGKISVNRFNTEAFATVKADRQILVEFVRSKVRIRAGFDELLAYCRRKGFKIVIVSNGLDFYIETVLKGIGVDNIDVFAAQAQFRPDGIETKYLGPDGNQLEDGFKDAYTRLFLREGHRLVYVGNGLSDVSAAKLAHHVFATGELLTLCKGMNLECRSFVDLNDVVKGLELL